MIFFQTLWSVFKWQQVFKYRCPSSPFFNYLKHFSDTGTSTGTGTSGTGTSGTGTLPGTGGTGTGTSGTGMTGTGNNTKTYEVCILRLDYK